MDIGAGPILTAGLTAVAGVVWLVRLEGRVNLVESHYADLKGDVSEIKSDVKALLKQK